jgi:single-stranded-DNA-specific exonuclease
MGHAALAVKMLTDAGEAEAMETAVYLEEQNRARQAIERTILDEALTQIEQRHLADDTERALVLASDSWHPGVIGIVAARLVDRFCRPTVLIATSNGYGQGSCRSIAGFHMAQALAACGDHLIAHGGHEMAAGLKLRAENFDAFSEAFRQFARTTVVADMMKPQLNLEAEAKIGQMSEALVGDLHRLGPFGHGNRKPLLLFRDVQVAAPPRVVGKTGQHLQLVVKQGNTRVKCIAFGQADRMDRLKPGLGLELAAEPIINSFNGKRTVELEVKDMHLADGIP